MQGCPGACAAVGAETGFSEVQVGVFLGREDVVEVLAELRNRHFVAHVTTCKGSIGRYGRVLGRFPDPRVGAQQLARVLQGVHDMPGYS